MARNEMTSAFEDRLDALKESVRGLVDSSSERADRLKSKMVDVKDSVFESSRTGINRLGELDQGPPHRGDRHRVRHRLLRDPHDEAVTVATESRDGGALRDRFDELAERLRELDLRGRIAANPWPVVGAAALLGAWFAFAPRREPRIALRDADPARRRRDRGAVRALRCGWRATPRSARRA